MANAEDPLKIKFIHTYSEIDIGTMRNTVCNCANGNYIALMDDDDFYQPYRIWYQYYALKKTGLGVSTIDSILCYNIAKKKCFNYDCSSESCLMFTRSYFDTHAFDDGCCGGEGGKFCKDENVLLIKDINLMMATNHSENMDQIRAMTKERLFKMPTCIMLDDFEKRFLENSLEQ